MKEKRNRRSCSIETKLQIIKYAEENPSSLREIAEKFSVGKSTVSSALSESLRFELP